MRYAILLATVLAGCADMPPQTPEQRAVMLQYIQLQQQNADAVMRAYQIPAQSLPPTVTCMTTPIGAYQTRTVCR